MITKSTPKKHAQNMRKMGKKRVFEGRKSGLSRDFKGISVPKLRFIIEDWAELKIYGRAWRVKPNAYGYGTDHLAFNPGQAHFDRVEVVFSRLTPAQQRVVYAFAKAVIDGRPHPSRERAMQFEDVDLTVPALMISFFSAVLEEARQLYRSVGLD